MKIKVFGPGCSRCNQTEQIIKEALASKGLSIDVEKISDLKEMMALGIISTPSVVIDEKIVASGRIPKKEEVLAWIEDSI